LKPPNGVEGRTDEFELIERTARLDRARERGGRSRRRASRSTRRARSRVVRDLHRLRLVRERDQGRNRAEDLLARDPVAGPRLDERRGVPEALAVRRVAR